MSTNINRPSSVEVLSPLKDLVSSKQSIDSTAKIESRLQDIDNRIITWKKIASKEQIDISEERDSLKCLRSGQEGSSIGAVRVFNLLLQEECRERICNRIVRKVKRNFKREPEPEKLVSLKHELFDLTNKTVLPWVKMAEGEGVDIKDEIEAMDAADKCSYEKLAEKCANPEHQLEVVQRRLKTLRTQCCIRIITKTYSKRVLDAAEKSKSKDWFNDKRIGTIEGIASDALTAMPQTGRLADLEKQCEEVFQLFKANITLFDENPKQYQELADREWLKREIVHYSQEFFKRCKKNKDIYNAQQVLIAHQYCMQLLESDMKTADVRERVNQTFDLFAERICGISKFGGCGFKSSNGAFYNRDDGAS